MLDIIIITVANKYQKDYLDNYLKDNEYYNNYKIYTIISNNGTGTALLDAIKLKEKIKCNNRVLLINSGGKSERTKLFAKNGKVFIPIPNNNSNTIILNKIIDFYNNIKDKILTDGILVYASDVILDNNITPSIKESCALSTLVKKEYGTEHGVFIKKDDYIYKFLHKQLLSILEKEKAIISNKVLIDTGVYFLDNNSLSILKKDYKTNYKNKEFINFYGEMINHLLIKTNLKLIVLKNTNFYHLGNYKKYQEYIFSIIKDKYYLYNSTIEDNVSIGNKSMIFNCRLNNITIPSNSIAYMKDEEIVIEKI